MSVRTRSTLPLLIALAILAAPAGAQELSQAPAPVAASNAAADTKGEPAVAPTTAGPTIQAATVAVRHQETTVTTVAAKNQAPGTALMIVGGAALLGGLVIGGNAGNVIAIGGLAVGLLGLYEYLQ